MFAVTAGYLLVIRRVAGFFVYDPQAGAAFDPAETRLGERRFDSARDTYDDTMKALTTVFAIGKGDEDSKHGRTGQPGRSSK